MAFLASRETKIQSLQFKTIHKRKMVDTPECMFCGASDNLVHLFYHVSKFLGRIKI